MKSWLKCDFLFHWLLLSSGRRKVQNKVNFGQNRNTLEQPIVFNHVGEGPLVISYLIKFTKRYNIVTQSLQQTTENEWLIVADLVGTLNIFILFIWIYIFVIPWIFRDSVQSKSSVKKKKRLWDMLAISTMHPVQMSNSACPPVSYKLLLQHL